MHRPLIEDYCTKARVCIRRPQLYDVPTAILVSLENPPKHKRPFQNRIQIGKFTRSFPKAPDMYGWL